MAYVVKVSRKAYNRVLEMHQNRYDKLPIIREIRDTFGFGLGYAVSLYDLVMYTEYGRGDLGYNVSRLILENSHVRISDHKIEFTDEPIQSSQEFNVNDYLATFIKEVQKLYVGNQFTHDKLRSTYINSISPKARPINHNFSTHVLHMFSEYVLNWPTERVTYLISFKDWQFLKSWFEVMGVDEADKKKITIIKQIRQYIDGCGLAEAKGLFELAHYKYCGSSKYATYEITMIGSLSRAMIKDIDVVHTV